LAEDFGAAAFLLGGVGGEGAAGGRSRVGTVDGTEMLGRGELFGARVVTGTAAAGGGAGGVGVGAGIAGAWRGEEGLVLGGGVL